MFSRPAFSRHGNRLVNASNRNDGAGRTRAQVTVWDIATGQKKGQLNLDREIAYATISPDGKTVAFALGTPFFTEGLELWDVDDNQRWPLVFNFDHPMIASAEFTGNGKILAASYFQDAKLFSVEKRALIVNLKRQMVGQADNLFAMTISADGKIIAGAPANPSTIALWHTPSRTQVTGPATKFKATSLLALSTDGRYLAVAGLADKRIQVWELARAGK
jgi:WD40 repeat protein